MKWENKSWYGDYIRQTDDEKVILTHLLKDYIFHQGFRYMVYYRKANKSKLIIKLYYDFRMLRLSRKYGIEIKSNTKIGKGFRMIHAYNITLSPDAVLGDNIDIMKGATIGRSEGKRKGAPIIGDSVYIGINSTIIGGIRIGNDVIIAPNAFVNVDVPDHSIVVGNPCNIIHKENATKSYVYYKV